jgi:hypothetical protein
MRITQMLKMGKVENAIPQDKQDKTFIDTTGQVPVIEQSSVNQVETATIKQTNLNLVQTETIEGSNMRRQQN